MLFWLLYQGKILIVYFLFLKLLLKNKQNYIQFYLFLKAQFYKQSILKVSLWLLNKFLPKIFHFLKKQNSEVTVNKLTPNIFDMKKGLRRGGRWWSWANRWKDGSRQRRCPLFWWEGVKVRVSKLSDRVSKRVQQRKRSRCLLCSPWIRQELRGTEYGLGKSSNDGKSGSGWLERVLITDINNIYTIQKIYKQQGPTV